MTTKWRKCESKIEKGGRIRDTKDEKSLTKRQKMKSDRKHENVFKNLLVKNQPQFSTLSY